MKDDTIAKTTAIAMGTNRNRDTPSRKNIGTKAIWGFPQGRVEWPWWGSRRIKRHCGNGGNPNDAPLH